MRQFGVSQERKEESRAKGAPPADDVSLHTMMPNPSGNKIVIQTVKPEGH
jgi:hypothetical protein